MPLIDDFTLFKNFDSFSKFHEEQGGNEFKLFLLTNSTRINCDEKERMIQEWATLEKHHDIDFYLVDKYRDVKGWY